MVVSSGFFVMTVRRLQMYPHHLANSENPAVSWQVHTRRSDVRRDSRSHWPNGPSKPISVLQRTRALGSRPGYLASRWPCRQGCIQWASAAALSCPKRMLQFNGVQGEQCMGLVDTLVSHHRCDYVAVAGLSKYQRCLGCNLPCRQTASHYGHSGTGNNHELSVQLP